MSLLRCTPLVLLLCASLTHADHHQAAAGAEAVPPGLSHYIGAEHRSAAHRARDGARHPLETLSLFGFDGRQTVIEIAPGEGYWSEILAPASAAAGGRYVAIVVDPAKAPSERARDYHREANRKLADKFAAAPEHYGQAEIRAIDPAAPVLGPPGSADLVLTFRNVHGWTRGGTDAAMFKAFHEVLKPGGVLGLEQHRAAPGADPKQSAATGYLPEAYVIELAKAAGFELVATSEINANPRDGKDHPNGVWTLPPTLNVPEGEDRAKYQAIGESDRMTLKFVKPAAATTSGPGTGRP